MILLLSQASQRERAAAAAVQLLDKDLTRKVRDATADVIVPMARDAVERHARTPTQRRIAASGTYASLRGVPGVKFGGRAPVTSTGVPGYLLVRGLEFGSPGKRTRVIGTHSRKGTPYKVRKRVTAQFAPQHEPAFVYPGVESIADDALDVWVSVVEAAFIDAWDGAVT